MRQERLMPQIIQARVPLKDVLDVTSEELRATLRGKPLSLLAGCAPCEGFLLVDVKEQGRGDRRNGTLVANGGVH